MDDGFVFGFVVDGVGCGEVVQKAFFHRDKPGGGGCIFSSWIKPVGKIVQFSPVAEIEHSPPGLPGLIGLVNRLNACSSSLHCTRDCRPDRANPMIAGAASANQIQIHETRCHSVKSRFALFRHGRRT